MDMEFNVSQLLKENVGGKRTIEFSTPELVLSEPVDTDDAELIATDVAGQAKLTRLKGRIRLVGDADAQVELVCSRCLTAFGTDVHAELEEIFHQMVDVSSGMPIAEDEFAKREEDEFTITKNHILDVSDAVRQAILVSLPMRPLHSEDCKGLCPTCGANLNEGDCGCVDEEIDPRFAALATLLADADRVSKN